MSCTMTGYTIKATPDEFLEMSASFNLGIFGLPSCIPTSNIICEWTDVTRISLKGCLGVMLQALPHEDRLALLQESLAAAMNAEPVHKAISEPPF